MKIIRKLKFLLYRLKWYLAYWINFKAPIHIDVELTSYCNLDCAFCFRRNKNFDDGFIDFWIVEKILKEAIELGVQSVKFNWRGEATLYPLYLQAINLAYALGFFIYINTNLTLNYSSDFLETIASKVDILKVSFDSTRKHVYEKIRKKADFYKVIDNLYFLEYLRKIFKMPKLIISRRTTNIKDLESNKEFKKWFKKMSLKYVKFDIKPAMKRNQEKIFKTKIVNKNKRKYCGHPSRRLVISWEGNVYVCCVAYNEPQELYLGNIKKESLKSIWNNKKRKELIKNLKKNIFTNKMCKFCTSRDAYK